MAEEILNTAITEEEEAPIIESPIVESTTIEQTIPDGRENLKLLHAALSGDKEYLDLVPKDFNKFIEQYKDTENATLLFQSLRGDKEYSDMIPSNDAEASAMFDLSINGKGLGKQSAVPSASVDGGSAMRGPLRAQPSTSQPKGVEGIVAGYGMPKMNQVGVEKPAKQQPKKPTYLSAEEFEAKEIGRAKLPSEESITVKREEVKQKANMPSAKVIAETTPEMLAEGQQRIIKREAERALFEQKAKQGNFLGMLQNSLVDSYTSTVNNTADMAMYLFSLTGIGMPPEYNTATNEEKAKILSETLDDMGIKKTLDKQLKTESTTPEYTQKRIEEGGPIMEGVVGLAGSAFPMLTPYQSGFFINGFVDAKKEIQEAMPELSPWKQAAYAFTQGAVQMALERAGFSNLVQNKSVTRALSGKVMDAMRTTFGKFTAKEADNVAAKIINGFAAEYETGATQYVVSEGLKQLADVLEGEDDKFEFEGTEQFFLNMNKAGISEGVGGGVMKTFSQIPSMIKSPAKKKEAAAINAQTEQLAADIQNPNVSPEAKVAIDKQINDNAEDVAKAYAEDSNKYEALPEESKADLNRINEDIISHEAVLNDPNVSPETKAISEQRIQELEAQGEGILDSAPVTERKAPAPITEKAAVAEAPQTLPEVTNVIATLRDMEQAEYADIDPNDEAKRKQIYDRYNELITPLLEQEKELKAEEAQAPVAEEAKGEAEVSPLQAAKESISKRVQGDRLLDAQDLVDELSDNKAEIDNDGMVTVYHRTTSENKKEIESTGKMKGLEDGVFFSTKETGQNEGYGDSVVKLKVPIESIEIDDTFGDEAHVRIPTKKAGQIIDVKEYLPSPTTEATSEQAPQAFPAQEGAESVEDKFQANSELEQIYRDLQAAVNKNIDEQTIRILKANPTEAMVNKVMETLKKKGIIEVDCN